MASASLQKQVGASLARARQDVGLVATGLGTLWMIHVVNVLGGGLLLAWGIVPRSLSGLVGIFVAPLLHANVGHLLANTVPFAILGTLLALRGRRDLVRVTAIATVGSGLGCWLFGGPGSVHIGASGVIFGWLGFLMARGLVERSIGSLAVSGLVTFWMGSMVWGVLPLAVGVSWQAHLFGLLAGIAAAVKLPRS
jgi:membrane associated rhomboid family serine protease